MFKVLLEWYDNNKRSFPWRERKFTNTDEHAYHTWVCEVMSQQTLLSVLLPKYESFLKELPNINALYHCSEDTLRNLWKGLGYYARARNLQKGAGYILNHCNGVFPKNQKEWEMVPGCGAYTSAIIASICYGENVPSIDGNVIRVGSRLLNIQDDSVWTPKGYQTIYNFFQNRISKERPGDFNQALMDLGATICKKYEPNCRACPFTDICLAHKNGTTQLCPPVKPRREAVCENIYTLLICNPKNSSQIGVLERTHGFLKKTIGFPLCAQKNNFSLKKIEQLANHFGGSAKVLQKTFRHSITHHKITGYVVVVEARENQFSPQKFLNNFQFEKNLEWIDSLHLKDSLSSSLDQKAHKIFLSKEQNA